MSTFGTTSGLLGGTLIALVSCRGPETFQLTGNGGGFPGVAGSFGTANTGGVAGSGAGGSFDAMSGFVGSGGATPGSGGALTDGMAGSGGAPVDAGTGGIAGVGGSHLDAQMDSALGQDVPAEKPPAKPYPSSNWKATASITAAGTADLPPKAFDGNITTRWTTGKSQSGAEWFHIDIGSPLPFSQVVLDDTTHPQDFPAGYKLEVSTDDMKYAQVALGAGTTITRIHFAPMTARYLRITQTKTTPVSWWSIDEITIWP